MSSSNSRVVAAKIDQAAKCREERCDASRQDALNAWKEYQLTGMHAGADEVIAWLDTWGGEREFSAPTGHK